MRLIQYIGPFRAGERITIPAQYDYLYVHIGIQLPHRESIKNIKDGDVGTDILINNIEYHVNETGILEFTDLAENSVTIQFWRDFPMEAIVDVAYRNTEN